MKFTWRNREAALRRIIVLTTCTNTTIQEAISATLHKADKDPDGIYRFRYSNHPAPSDAVRGKLEADALEAVTNIHSERMRKVMS